MRIQTNASLISTLFGSSGKKATSDALSKRLEGKNRSLTYAEWLERNAPQDGGTELRTASTRRAKSSPDYGAAAEAISDRGLDRSGYADYLRDKNEETYRKAAAGIAEQNAARDAGKGYLAYLKDWETAQDKLMKKTLSNLASTRVTNISDAYADALSAGLTDDRARLVSRVAPSLGKYGTRRLRQGIAGVLAVSLSAGLSGAEAELLARAFGIPEEDAGKLRETIEQPPAGGRTSVSGDWERK